MGHNNRGQQKCHKQPSGHIWERPLMLVALSAEFRKPQSYISKCESGERQHFMLLWFDRHTSLRPYDAQWADLIRCQNSPLGPVLEGDSQLIFPWSREL